MASIVDYGAALTGGAFAFAVIAGTAAGLLGAEAYRRSRLRRRMHDEAGLRGRYASRADENATESLIAYVANVSRRISLRVDQRIVPDVFVGRIEKWFQIHGKKAGLGSSAVTAEGLADASLRLGCVGALGGCLFGCCLSASMAIVGLVCGAAFGIMAPFRAVLSRQRMRSVLLERELSEMLEVVALALRSGLSFDRGFELYCQHFRTPFAQSCEVARRTWVYGLDSRESALRELAGTYDSPQLERAVQSVIRSIRFGSSLAEVLDQLASDVRQAHRAHVQERVAKAPVKMMIPTGVLILPAMLLLVMGPVLLEMMSGF